MREYLTIKQLRKYSLEKIERLQNARFRAMCRYILPQVPYYKKLFQEYGAEPESLRNPEDWQKKGLPLIKKTAYIKNPEEFVARAGFTAHLNYLASQGEYSEAIELLLSDKKEKIKHYYQPKMMVYSGGTESGNPTPVFLTAAQKFDTMKEVLKLAGELVFGLFAEEHTTGMNLFPYAPHIGWHAVHHALDINAELNLCTAAGGAMPTERLIAIADKMKPNIICGMSDYLKNRFLPMAIKKKIILPEKTLFINGAQKMHEAERERIALLAGKTGVKEAIVLDLYGASELKEALLPECRQGSGYHHIAPLSAIIKTVEAEDTGKEVIEEWEFSDKGYAAIWNIDGGGTLLEGYFIGDRYDEVTRQKCPYCNLNVMRIKGINRIREVEAQYKLTGIVEEKVKGTKVNLAAIREKALSFPEVNEAQVVLNRKKNKIELYYVSEQKNTMKRLENAFAGAEIKPRLIRATMKRLQGEKAKFEAIKVL